MAGGMQSMPLALQSMPLASQPGRAVKSDSDHCVDYEDSGT